MRRGVWAATISKTSTFEVLKFSQIFFPFVGFCLRARQLLRLDTAASGSRQRPWFGCAAAPRGQGSGGCARWRLPWPRMTIRGENPLESMGSWWRKWMQCWLFKIICGHLLILYGKWANRVYVFCTLCLQIKHFLLTILVLLYFGATIAVQNGLQICIAVSWTLTFWLLEAK